MVGGVGAASAAVRATVGGATSVAENGVVGGAVVVVEDVVVETAVVEEVDVVDVLVVDAAMIGSREARVTTKTTAAAASAVAASTPANTGRDRLRRSSRSASSVVSGSGVRAATGGS